jgi:general secretion pathway protein D
MKSLKTDWVLALALACMLGGLPAVGWAQPDPAEEPPTETDSAEAPTLDPDEIIVIAIQKDGIPLSDFLQHASQQTGRTFVIGPKADAVLKAGRSKSVQITNAIEVRRVDYFDTFKAILKANELHVFPIGNPETGLYLVEDLSNNASKADAKTRAEFVPYDELMADASWQYRTDIISTVIEFKHMAEARAKTDLQQIVNTREAGAITTVPEVNSIIVTEFAPTVFHVARMLKLMDQSEARFELIFEKLRLVHADPEELQPILADLLETEDGDGLFGGAQQARASRARGGVSSGAAKKPSPKIIPDSRTNSLIVYAVEEDLTAIKDLVEKLDEEVKEVVPDIYRYQLKHAVAEEVAETLNEVVEASTGSRRLSSARSAGARSQQTAGGGYVEQEIVIVPENHTNSLLIRASGTQYAWLQKLLEDIDRRLPQVLIEAAIVELAENFSEAFGVELGYLDLADDPNAEITRGFGFTGFGITEFIDQDGDGIPELRLPSLENLASGGFTGGIFRFPGFQVPFILQMIAGDNKSNLLSIPSVLTNDNGSATITVSESQTTTTSSLSGGGVSQGGFGGYEEAPLTLSISPHISADDYLRLDIELLVENFTGTEREVNGQVIPAPKTTREVLASVTVPNGATVVLGGLTQKQATEDRSKVPFLGDLPLVGFLFRNTQSTERRSTLYLFVTPHILKDEKFEDLFDITYQSELEVQALVGDAVNLFDPAFAENQRRREAEARRSAPRPGERPDLLDIPRYRSPSELEPMTDETVEVPTVEGEE